MLHILPCGNKGSFEQKNCSLMKNGIQKQKNNRFFFEDRGHLRRMTSHQVQWLFQPYGFNVVKEYYSNNYYGTINWVSRSNLKFILKFTDYRLGKDFNAKVVILLNRIQLIFLYYLRGAFLNKKSNIVFLDSIFAYFHEHIEDKAENEWINNKLKTNGSAMYLFFSRID